MPTWAAVTLGLLSGVTVGLLATVLRLIEERGAPVRQATLDAGQDLAALASDWFDAVEKAIDKCRDELGDCDQERDAANRLIHEGRKRLDRLAVIVGPGSEVVRQGALTLNSVQAAVRVLPKSDADVMDDVARDEEDHEPSDEEEFAALVGDTFDERIDAASNLLHGGLTSWGHFTYEASRYFHRGLLQRQRAAPRAGVDHERRPSYRRPGS